MSALKRAKTTTTYSTKKPTSSSIQREQFLAEFGQDATAPGTSPSVRFSDHSGARGSSGLPAGSFQAGFIDHEPAMFKESGSTVPDNESSHERMVEQALRSKSYRAPSSPGIKLVDSDELPRSSSFPSSASEQTGSAKSHRTQNLSAPAGGHGAQENATSHQTHDTDERHRGQSFDPVHGSNDTVIPAPATAVMVAPSDKASVQRSSPTVHIEVHEMKAQTLPEPATTSIESAQKAGRGRKRKIQEESSEPLNSDDLAVGLPKERYKPRPSRRRATQTAEEQIDYSVVPEKAAKSKRSKTMGSNAAPLNDEPLVASKTASPSVERKSASVNPTDVPGGAITAANSLHEEETASGRPDAFKPSPVVQVPATVESLPSQPKQTSHETKTVFASEASDESSLKDDTVFVKPALKPKPASKSKRSSTTIFEDHVDFTRKSKSPSLSQQQAIRQSALRDVKNEASPAKPRRGRKPVIQDDDEDELAADPALQDHKVDEPPDEPPKKRGRGRPPKAAAMTDGVATAKSAKKTELALDSDDDGDEIAIEKPAKKPRGRPKKSAASEPGIEESKDTVDVSENASKQPEEEATAEKSIENTVDDGTPAKQNTIKEIPTPSPENQLSAGSSVGPEKPVKPSPATHSPIKSKSPAPYRVGLSKKHRIPSLLRVMRPPPPKRG